MYYDVELHRRAYLVYRSSQTWAEFLERVHKEWTELGINVPSEDTFKKWSQAKTKCACPWHGWSELSRKDIPTNHKTARSLALEGKQSLRNISEVLGVPADLVQEWGMADFPCSCGYHGWLPELRGDVSQVEDQLRELVEVVESTPSAEVLPEVDVPEHIRDATHVATLSVIRGLIGAIETGKVVPRSWKDVIDTLQTLKSLLPDLSRRSLPYEEPSQVTPAKTTEVSAEQIRSRIISKIRKG